jgi:hypothetical protein
MSGVTSKKPVDLFDYSNLEKSYKDLIKIHHPDKGGNQADFLHVTQCYEIAKKEIKLGYAVGNNKIHFFKERKGFPYKSYDYNSFFEFSYGKVYDGPECVIYEFAGSTLHDEIQKVASLRFPFPNAEIEEKFRSQTPRDGFVIDVMGEGGPERQVYLIKKEPSFMLLNDIIPHGIPLETSVWMFNRLYALGCYMQMVGLYNLDISPYTVSFNLEKHIVQLLGGWWYTAKEGQKISKMPLTTYSLLTNKMKEQKTASIEIVTEQIKNVMRTMLAGKDLSNPYKNWLSLPAQENIVDEYYQWEHEVMPKIFPVRKFYKWII